MASIWWRALHLTLLARACLALVCWHCISDNCDLNPEENTRAEQKGCMQGQTCQKVLFEMKSDIDGATYSSTVRSCADECTPMNDFNNCTEELYSTRGCVQRACCADGDLCNNGSRLHDRHNWLFLSVAAVWTINTFL